MKKILNIFDLDKTLFFLKIDYDKMRNELQKKNKLSKYI